MITTITKCTWYHYCCMIFSKIRNTCTRISVLEHKPGLELFQGHGLRCPPKLPWGPKTWPWCPSKFITHLRLKYKCPFHLGHGAFLGTLYKIVASVSLPFSNGLGCPKCAKSFYPFPKAAPTSIYKGRGGRQTSPPPPPPHSIITPPSYISYTERSVFMFGRGANYLFNIINSTQPKIINW